MRWPIVLFALLLLAVQLIQSLREGMPGERAHAVPEPGVPLTARLFQDALPAFLFLTTLALTTLAFGEPAPLVEWGAWAVLGLQVLRGAALWQDELRIQWGLGLLILVLLIVLWASQIPVLDSVLN
jgi:hypothetical protein